MSSPSKPQSNSQRLGKDHQLGIISVFCELREVLKLLKGI